MAEVNFLVKKGLTVPKGSASTPAIIFDAADTDCGLFSPAANQVAISVQGSASAPALSFGSDSNTGIYSPAADQLAISTNGTGRLFVDASGGIAVPFGLTKTNYGYAGEFGGDVSLRTGVTGTECSLQFLLGSTATPNALGKIAFNGTSTDGYFTLTTRSSNALYERLRITSDGKLGLGTSSPTERLEVTGNLKLSSIGTGSIASSYALLFYGTTSGAAQTDQAKIHSSPWAANSNGGNLQFYTSNGSNVLTERMRIDGAGNVGIGVTSPSSLLHLADAGDITVGTTTGTKIGTATSQKIGFYNATPVVQPTTGVAEAAFVENSGGTAVNVDSTFGGYTIQQVVQALQTLGLLA